MGQLETHGWIVLVVIAAAESRLFAGQPFVATGFTPFVWTGDVPLASALALRLLAVGPIAGRLWVFRGFWALLQFWKRALHGRVLWEG